jgi:uncharacterized protein YndB with AHSA1/START domain
VTETTNYDQGVLVAFRVLSAPQQLVWSAFTTPGHVAAFWGGGSATINVDSVVIDVRVGGTFELVTVAPDGTAYPKRGEYLEIDEPHRIVFTEPDTGITTTITLVARAGRTELTVHQTDVPPQLATPQAESGLTTMIRRLEALLDRLM